MNKIRKGIITSLGLLPFLMPVDAGAVDQTSSPDELLSSGESMPWRKARFSIEAQTGSRTIGTLDAFVPFMGNDDFIVYADIMTKLGTGAKNKNGSTWEGNAGLGFRRVNDSETAIYGAYAFFDYINSVNDNKFQQVTVGAERLGLTWDFRINGYIPIGTKEYTKDTISDIIIDEHNLIAYYKAKTEKVTSGGDIEVGRTLGSDKWRGYLAAYTFGKDLTGPRARVEYKINDHFTLNAAIQYDKDRGTQYFMGARFTIGGAKATKSNSIYSRLTDTVVRDVDIVTKETSIDNSMVVKDKLWVVDTDKEQYSNGDGTIDNPYGYLDEAIEAAPEDAIIYIIGSNGKRVNQLSDKITLKDGQILWGGSKALYWDLDKGMPVYDNIGNVATVREATGEQQILGGGIEMANNSVIYNFNVQADDTKFDTAGIIVNNKQNVTIKDVNISNFKSKDASNPYEAISITGDNSSVSFNNISISNSDIGVAIDGGVVSFNDINISNSTTFGMLLKNATITAGDIIISNSGINGVYAENVDFSAGNLSIDGTRTGDAYYQMGGSAIFDGDVNISNSANSGLVLENVNFAANNINISTSFNGFGITQTGGSFSVGGDVKVSDSGADGIHFENTAVTVGNADVSNSVGFGLWQQGGSFTSGDLNVNTSGKDGIHFLNTAVTGGSVTVADSQGHGYFQQGQKATLAGGISINGSGINGLTLNDVDFNADSITINKSLTGYGIEQTGGSLTVENAIDVSQSGKHGLYTIGAMINAGSISANNNYLDGVNANNTSIITSAVTTNDNKGNGLVIDGMHGNTQNVLGNVTANNNSSGNGVNFLNTNVLATSMSASQNQYGVYIDNSQVQVLDADANSTISNNTLDGIIMHGINSHLDLQHATISDNARHGIQINDDSVVDLKDVTVSGNGLESAKDAKNLNDLLSGIKINAGTLNAERLIVQNNAGGIELLRGYLNINDGALSTGQRSSISNNLGYGVYGHGVGENDVNSRTIDIRNTDIKGNKKVNDIEKSGSGIVTTDMNGLTLANIAIMGNEAAGINMNVTSGEAHINIANGNISNNGADGIKVNANEKIEINLSADSHVNNNANNGINAVSTQKNVAISVVDSTINGNQKDGIHLETEIQATNPSGNSITNYFTLINSELKGNAINGIYLKQKSTATALFNLENAVITGNGNPSTPLTGGLYITNGTLDGTKVNTDLQSNNNIGYITRKGDFIND